MPVKYLLTRLCKVIKEPVISVSDYTRGSTTSATKLTDQELTLVVDGAKAFKFIVDDGN